MAAAPDRPLDPELTAALLSSTLDLLSRDDLCRVNTAVIATHAQAGEAAIHRRWSSLQALIADAMASCALIPEITDQGSVQDGLWALFQPWTRPLDRCELAAAALLHHAGHDAQLDEVLTRSVVQPLAATVSQIADHQAANGSALSVAQRQLLIVVVQSLWWQRYYEHAEPFTTHALRELIDQVLVPVATG